MRYVIPNHPSEKIEEELRGFIGLDRLYAYPGKPSAKNGGRVILDSGAYGLSVSGGKMTDSYMTGLNRHYTSYSRAIEGLLCAAPDVYPDPVQTLVNFQRWQGLGYYSDICPVIQLGEFYDADIAVKQAEIYSTLTQQRHIFIGNNMMTGKNALAFRVGDMIAEIKRIGFEWVHIFGAGWNIHDIQDWMRVDGIDSMDSISYQGKRFGSDDPVQNVRDICELVGQ